VRDTSVADVRYLVSVIPLCIAMEVMTLICIFGKNPMMALGIGLVAFTTNLLHGGPFFPAKLLPDGTRAFKYSAFASYLHELIVPPADPYTPTAQWINEHVSDGATIWVVPDYMPYSLMFHAPKAVYGWQLKPPVASQFTDQPGIQFEGRIPPDYIVAFGPVVRAVAQMVQQWSGVRYEHAATIDHFWKDMHRPELFWRTFQPITNYNKQVEAIYVFKRIEPALLPVR
jgi:hypothetical protein